MATSTDPAPHPANRNLAQFPRFLELPLEIRQRIWSLSIPGVLIMHSQIIWDSEITSKNVNIVSSMVPAGLSVCTESRCELLRILGGGKPPARDEGVGYGIGQTLVDNFDRSVFYLNLTGRILYFSFQATQLRDSLKRIALLWTTDVDATFSDPGFNARDCASRYREAFPKLEWLIYFVKLQAQIHSDYVPNLEQAYGKIKKLQAVAPFRVSYSVFTENRQIVRTREEDIKDEDPMAHESLVNSIGLAITN